MIPRDATSTLRKLATDAAMDPMLVYAGDTPQERRGIAARPWRELAR